MLLEVSCNVAPLNATNDVAFMVASELKTIWRSFGSFIRSNREAQNLSQESAGEIIGMSRQQWQRIESGSSGTKRETVLRIAEALKLDENEALNRAGFIGEINDQSRIELPNGFEIIGFEDEIEPDDKREIAQFLEMKRDKAKRKREAKEDG